MLKTRLITAAVLIISLFITLFFASNLVWSYIALLVMLIGAFEWSRLATLKPAQTIIHMGASLTIGLLIVYSFNQTYDPKHEFFMLTTMATASFLWLIFVPFSLFTNKPLPANRFIKSIIGIIMLSATLIAFIGLHKISPVLFLGIIATVSIADSAAYFAGKRFGKHKLAPSISPGKTWEGVMGALLAIAIVGAAVTSHLNYGVWLVLGLMCLVILSIMGDLFESKLKREAGMKDSGSILPGHGGILDRIDGMIPTATLTLFYIYLPLYLSNGLNI